MAGGAAPVFGAAADIWPAQITGAADEKSLNQRIVKLEAAAAALPAALTPGVRFEEAFVRAIAGAAEAEWLPPMRTLADASGADPVTAALRDVAKAWIARVEMPAIGTVLDGYYVQHVRYPATLTEVAHDLPKELQLDPWGEAWAYRPHAPAGFAREGQQRYSLGPGRYPALGMLVAATTQRPPFVPPAWKIALRPAGAGSALEFSDATGVIALLQAGGKVGDDTLVYIGDHWALLAAPDQLFTVTF